MAKILVGEDDDNIRNVFRMYLTMQQHQVALAASKEEILEQVYSFNPDLVLLDVMLNGEDGREVCRELKSANKNAKVILLSASEHLLEDYWRCEADAIILKPFDLSYLNLKIEQVLNSSLKAS
jgi:DNA-binding response OmpR family regulator